ncbi:hypothetical protein [Microbacterium sp. H1-D42]|uniref:hypothetical protein n=1 Tax=Microbacterium sp. H1-D42 TaxID=2925844 RepID=UPI001F52C3CA|nr:hypothetical protein [Microbacterium sp. H1-D42]UNK70646.1 hypothetical protein MNR00_16035 [Microbacterium sp. H1-D42]
MDLAVILKYTLIVIAVVLVGLLAKWARSRPNRAKRLPERVRMPKIVPIIGWILIIVGTLMVLAAFTRPAGEEEIGMQIASVAIVACGVFFLVMYRNWYIAPGADEIVFRTVWGAEKAIRYADIVTYEVRPVSAQPTLLISASDGTRFRVNLATYDVAPLIAHLEYHQKNGRWPVRGELGPLPG